MAAGSILYNIFYYWRMAPKMWFFFHTFWEKSGSPISKYAKKGGLPILGLALKNIKPGGTPAGRQQEREVTGSDRRYIGPGRRHRRPKSHGTVRYAHRPERRGIELGTQM